MSRWDTYRAKYDGGFQDFSMIAAAYEDYKLRPSYWQLLLMTMSTSKGPDPINAPLNWQVIKAHAGIDSIKKRVAAFQRSDGEQTFMLLNETGADNTTISIENLPTDKTYNVYYWNQNGDGHLTVGTPITPGGTVSSHSTPGSGTLSLNVNRQAYAVVTSLTLDPSRWDESIGAPPAPTTEPLMIPPNRSIDYSLHTKPYIKFSGPLSRQDGTALMSGETVTGFFNVYSGSGDSRVALVEGTEYSAVYTTEVVNNKDYSTLSIQPARTLVRLTNYTFELKEE